MDFTNVLHWWQINFGMKCVCKLLDFEVEIIFNITKYLQFGRNWTMDEAPIDSIQYQYWGFNGSTWIDGNIEIFQRCPMKLRVVSDSLKLRLRQYQYLRI